MREFCLLLVFGIVKAQSGSVSNPAVSGCVIERKSGGDLFWRARKSKGACRPLCFVRRTTQLKTTDLRRRQRGQHQPQ